MTLFSQQLRPSVHIHAGIHAQNAGQGAMQQLKPPVYIVADTHIHALQVKVQFNSSDQLFSQLRDVNFEQVGSG
jgi:hypothetical protein